MAAAAVAEVAADASVAEAVVTTTATAAVTMAMAGGATIAGKVVRAAIVSYHLSPAHGCMARLRLRPHAVMPLMTFVPLRTLDCDFRYRA